MVSGPIYGYVCASALGTPIPVGHTFTSPKVSALFYTFAERLHKLTKHQEAPRTTGVFLAPGVVYDGKIKGWMMVKLTDS